MLRIFKFIGLDFLLQNKFIWKIFFYFQDDLEILEDFLFLISSDEKRFYKLPTGNNYLYY